ncbi:MAG TPA: DUF92 domain-containing protein [Chthonomonadaceae bacterium]|nr:DUF92 domain-containing protein [Chthonomonadaceae bacterium]
MIYKLIAPDWWAALATAAGFALLARWLRLLTASGAVATFVVGCIVFGLGGGLFAVPLLTFFFTSSYLSRLGRRRKAAAAGVGNESPPYAMGMPASDTRGAPAPNARGAVRDHVQVLANGGVACGIVVLFRMVGATWPTEVTRCLLMLYLAALATVNADTWATEIGGLSATPPRLLNNWKQAHAGASGAVTPLGLVAAALGSLLVTGAGWLVWRLSVPEFIAVAWAGFLGCFLDSILGASLQAEYRHPETGERTERAEIEGVRTVRTRGVAWMTNDAVNFLASLGGVACAWLLLRAAGSR